MIASNAKTADSDLRELSTSEIDGVSGAFFPLLVLAFAVGFDIGFIASYGFGSTGLE